MLRHEHLYLHVCGLGSNCRPWEAATGEDAAAGTQPLATTESTGHTQTHVAFISTKCKHVLLVFLDPLHIPDFAGVLCSLDCLHASLLPHECPAERLHELYWFLSQIKQMDSG